MPLIKTTNWQEGSGLLEEISTEEKGKPPIDFPKEPRKSRTAPWIRTSVSCQWVVGLLLGAILVAAIFAQAAQWVGHRDTTVDTLDQAHQLLPHPRDNGTCGGSAVEARALGCAFDIVEFSWLPKTCLGNDADEYLAIHDWMYFDDNMTEVSNETVWKGESTYLWITWRQHLVHCTFMWKRLHRAALLRKPTDSYIADYEHTTHCTDMLLREGMALDDVNVQLFVKFPTCGVRLDRDDLGYPWPAL